MKPIAKRPLIPVITDLLEYKDAALNTIGYTRNMVAKYGDVCEVSFTGIRNYFVHDPEVIKEILTTYGPKCKRTRLFRAFRKFLGNGLFTADDPYHKQQRRMIKPAFLPQRIEEYSGIMVQCALEEVSKWQDGQQLNINQAMTNITINVITQTLFGTGLDEKVIERVKLLMPAAFNVMNDIVQNPFYVYCLERGIRIPLVKRFYKVRGELDEIINGIIASYRNTDNEDRHDLLSMLMAMRDEDSGKGMTDQEIRDEVITFFVAGHETTTLALSWTLYLLGSNPGIMQDLHAEVAEVIGNRTPASGDYQQLHLTRNIVRESLRLYPPAWTFAREPMEDLEICGYHFPKGCVLWTVTYLIHHNEKYFREPGKFMPARWDTEEIKHIPRYAYFPFGGGNRMCIGEGFAWMEAVLVLATIVSKCRLHMEPGFTTTVDPLFSLKMKEELVMRVERI